MEDFNIIVANLLLSNEDKNRWKFYNALMNIKLNIEDVQKSEIIHKLYALYEKNIIRKDLILFSLLVNEDKTLFEQVVAYDNSKIKLDLEQRTTIFDYTQVKKRNWFLDIIEEDYPNLDNIFNQDVLLKIYFVKLIYFSNLQNVDIEDIKHVFNKIEHKIWEDEIVTTYTNETKHILNVIEHVTRHTKENCDTTELYYYVWNNCVLNVLSNYTNLDESDNWSDITKLVKDEELLKENYNVQDVNEYTQSEIFASFTILYNTIKCIKLCQTLKEEDTATKCRISAIVEENKQMILQIKKDSLLVEILENIFLLIFIKESSQSQFFNNTNELFLIILFLKAVINEITSLKRIEKHNEVYKRYCSLCNYVTDALWRLELITTIKNENEDTTNNVLQYMLATPESLICFCLEKGNFDKANEVIQIFNLENTSLVKEIRYTEKLLQLKNVLRKISKLNSLKLANPVQYEYNKSVEKAIDDHFKNFHKPSEEFDEIISKNRDILSIQPYGSTNNALIDIFDLAITFATNYVESQQLIDIYFKHFKENPNEEAPYHKLLLKLNAIFTEYAKDKNMSMSHILLKPNHILDIEKQRKEDELYNNLGAQYASFKMQITHAESGVLNPKHTSHKTFLKLQELSLSLMKLNGSNDENKEIFKYLQRLYYYLKEFSKIFYIESNNSNLLSEGKNISYFEILNVSRHELIGKLLFERNLSPTELENFFSKIKLDLCYHVSANCFPLISLSNIENQTATNINSLYRPTASILSYIRKHNWLLGFIINEIFNVENSNIDMNETRVKYIYNYVKLPTIQNLKELYDNNEYVTAIQYKIDIKVIENYFNETIQKYDMEELRNVQFSELSTESCEEVSEGFLKTINWRHLYDIIDNVPQLQYKESNHLQDLHDVIICNLVSERYEPEYYRYVQYIDNNELRLNMILRDMMHWPGEFCSDLIESELTRFEKISNSYQKIFFDWKVKIKLYEQLRCIFPHKSWYDIKELCENSPNKAITSILQTHEVDILMLFIDIHNIDEYLQRIDLNYIMSLFDANLPLKKITKLFDKLPTSQVIEICQNLIKLLRKLEYLQFVTDVLLKISKEDVEELLNIKICLKILSQISQQDQDHLWCLICEPLSIIEVFLMNTKLDKLGQIIEYIKPDLINNEYDDNVISIEKIDEVLRRYAEKSLDFRVITQPNPKFPTPESKLMQSLDSLIISNKKDFVMPDSVPNKLEWIENNEVIECMCCQETRFSMFNRRHHCRRCGRVVCWSCSTKRMLVPTYEDILVRVCIDCYEQTHGDCNTSKGDTTGSSSLGTSSFCDAWLLSDDPEHNAIIREEFSFEHAPNVSLCLAILKNHSKNDEYPKFLLNQCDSMLKLLQPLSVDPIREIDYMLVIKMMKTLAMTAKMSCSHSMLQWGVTLSERILTQADLLTLLVERGCLNLLPPQKNNPYIDSAILRRLRDKLLDKEEWNLALEVSTKAGLDNTSVFAAWGKSCLKAGCLFSAREKFQRCFEKILHKTSEYFLSSDSDSSRDGLKPIRHLRISSTSDMKPVRTPPLLKEIIQMLESNSTPIDEELLKVTKNNKLHITLNRSQNLSGTQVDVAVCILNKLKHLNAIAAGNYYSINEEKLTQSQKKKPYIEPIIYKECLFYLQKYGTHLSLLEFYVKHKEFHDALLYLIENRLTPDIFIEIYMICLKSGVVNKLQENMSSIDSTLNLWKDYLNSICKHLEKQCLLHSIYQLQQFMCDYVRASLTCIKFYVENAITFTELSSRVKYLYKSQEHLKQELDQDQWIEVTAVSKVDTSEDIFEEKTVVNPSLVLKMDSKSIEKCIEIINTQVEVVKFLAQCESEKPLVHYIPKINIYSTEEKYTAEEGIIIPTLIYNYDERVQLAVLTIIAGQKVMDGFGLAYKIINEFKLKAIKVYCQAGKILAEENRYSDLAQLVGCIQNTGEKDSAVTYECDEMLLLAVRTISNSSFDPHQVDELVKFITDKGTKINAYIECKQLKSAYVLALKFNRSVDIRRIMHEAELLNKPDVIKLCKRALQTHSPSGSKDNKITSKLKD